MDKAGIGCREEMKLTIKRRCEEEKNGGKRGGEPTEGNSCDGGCRGKS